MKTQTRPKKGWRNKFETGETVSVQTHFHGSFGQFVRAKRMLGLVRVYQVRVQGDFLTGGNPRVLSAPLRKVHKMPIEDWVVGEG